MIMKYFLDTEFIEDGRTIDLISIAVVCEDGREFYACNLDCDLRKADNWIEKNVMSQLPPFGRDEWQRRYWIANDLYEFIECEPNCEFWGYYPATDWVALYQLYGKLIYLPKPFPKLCFDIKQLHATTRLSDGRMTTKLPKPIGAHNALVDARWNREFYNSIMKEIADDKRAQVSG